MCKKSLLSLMLLCFAFFGMARAQSELTVYEGTTTNNVVPAYIFYFDDFTRVQHVIPADDLAEMNGGTITSLKYYTTASNVPYTAVSSARVYLMEVDYTTMTGLEPIENGTVVFEGYFDVVSEGEGGSLTIEFATPYTYGGGNLLVGIENTEDAGYKSIYFYGQTVTGASWGGSNGSSLEGVTGSQRNFIPQTTFTYTAGATDCEMPAAIAVSEITHEGAVVNWEGDGNTWNLRYKASTDEDYTMVNGLTETSYTFSGLNGNTNYSVGVQTVCSGSTSYFKSTSFTTLNPCAAPTDLQVSDITPSSATLTWTAGYQETSWTVKYKKSTDETWTEETVTGTPTLSLTGLEGLTTYNVQVYNCESYVSGSFTTAAAFPYAQDFSASGIPTGWTQYTGLLEDVMAGTATLTSTSYGWSNGTDHNVLDGNHLYSNIYGTTCKKWIVSPAIPMESGARLTFDVAYTCYSSSGTDPQTGGTDDKFVVLASTDNMATWTILRQWDNAGSEFVLDELTPTTLSLNFDMADYAGTNLNIAFYAESTVSNADNNIHVDNVVFELIPACEKPTNLAVNYENGTSATFTWTENGTATSWDLQCSTDAEFTSYTQYQVDGTPSFEITGLELATTYYVRVNAFCDTPSEYSNIVSFSTDMCMPENQCELTFVLTDAWGDGWNNAYIEIVDVLTATSLGTVTNQNLNGTQGSGENELNTVTFAVCDGREIQFVWHSGSYDSECSYVVTDINGEEIFSGSGAMSNPVNYTVSCVVSTCKRPTNLATSEVGSRSAVLSWTENGEATEWVVEITDVVGGQITEWNASAKPYTIVGLEPETNYSVRVRPICSDFDDKWSTAITFTTDVACPKPTNLNVTAYPTSADVAWEGLADAYDLEWALLPATESKDPYNDGNWYYYDNGTYVGSVGLGGGEFHWGVMFPAGTYEGTLVSKVKAYDINAMVGTLAIYNDGETAPANQISIQDVEFTGAGDWVEFTTNAIIDPSKNVWIVFDAVDGAAYPMGTSNDDNGDANGRWVEINGTWYDMANVGVTGRANMLRAYIELGADPEELDWNPVSGITSPYTIEGLQPETTYVVRVKAVCGGDDGESAWTMTTFTTPSACDMPNTFSAEVEATSATLSWVGYQESFNLRYRRTPYVATTYFSENFDEGLPTTWTTIDNDTTTVGNWIALSEISNVYTYYTSPLTGWAHSGDDAVASASYVNGVGSVATDNYLVTPQVTFNGKLRFYATSEYSDPDTYEVLLSTTGNSISDFNVTLQAMGPATYGAWDEVIIDLSDYAGQQGYIAIHHVATDKYWLVIDDFGMYDFVYEDWTNVTATENTYTATGLTPEAEYEWQVQGVNPSCDGGLTEWSEIQSFTTLVQTTVTQTIELQEGTNWVSFYVDVTLDDLKAALVNALGTSATITIKSQGQNTKYSRGRWTGQMDPLDMAHMYKITVSADCEIAFEGMPLDPTTLSVTINANGSTWIAFPYNTGMTVAEFFGTFPTNNDQVKSVLQNTKYNRGRWAGSLTTLEPGSGYVYVSADTNPRTFTFPAAAKAGQKGVQKTMKKLSDEATKKMQNTTDLVLPRK